MNTAVTMKLDINIFRDNFFELTTDFDWEIQGFIDQNNSVYPIDSDTKVISTVFERLASPVIRTVAKSANYVVETANQTTYPDFTLTKFGSENSNLHRIAIDIKTTYIEPKVSGNGYKKTKLTLGSYKSYIRNDTKNILYPYSTYHEHWVLGYIYTRGVSFKEYDLATMPKRGDIVCPYNVKSVFIREKVDLTGIKPGSGNTANIGSFEIQTLNGFRDGIGPFSTFGNKKGAADFFWSNFERLKNEIKSVEQLHEHADFQRFYDK